MVVKVEDDGEEETYGWLRRLLEAAEVSNLFNKAAAWAEDAGCVESDLQDQKVLHDLLNHLELSHQHKRLRKAVAGSTSPTSAPCSPPTPPTSAGMAKLASFAPELLLNSDEIAISSREGNKLLKMLYYVGKESLLDDSMLGVRAKPLKAQGKLASCPQAGLAAEEERASPRRGTKPSAPAPEGEEAKTTKDGDFFFTPEPRRQVTSPEPVPITPNSEGRKVIERGLKTLSVEATALPVGGKVEVHEILNELLLSPEGTQSKLDKKASADQAMKDAAQLETEARSQAKKIRPNRTRKRRHVVISPKFQEPFFYFSVLLKVILQMLGCTVYNPNTDNDKTDNEEAIGRRLLTFNENLELVKKTEGFVLQLQGNKWLEKSHMQWAEEKQSGWLDVPRIGIWLSWSSNYKGYTYLLQRLVNAIRKSDGQWATERATGVVMCNEVYEGQRNTDGMPHGYGKVTFPTGDVYEGSWENGWRSGHGKFTFASGDVYEGNWENSKFSGHGKFAYASGAIYEGNWKNGKRNGQGKHTSASGVVQDGEWKDGNFKG